MKKSRELSLLFFNVEPFVLWLFGQVLRQKEDIKCHNFFAMEHTKWVETTLTEKSKIVSNAVKNNDLLIAKCHFDHSTGLVNLI